MSTFFWWFFDALVIIIAGYVLYSNGKRGVTKVLLLGIGYFIAALAAAFVSNSMAPVLYESMTEDSTISEIEHVNRRYDMVSGVTTKVNIQNYGFTVDKATIQGLLEGQNADRFIGRLYSCLKQKNGGLELLSVDNTRELVYTAVQEGYGRQLGEDLPVYVQTNFEEKTAADPELTRELITLLLDPKQEQEAIRFTEEKFVKDPTMELLQIFSYLIIFSIVMVLAAFIAATMENKFFFNNTRAKERLLGALVGIVEAVTVLMLLTLVVRMLVMLGGGELLCFNEPTIQESKLFSHFYNHLDFIL